MALRVCRMEMGKGCNLSGGLFPLVCYKLQSQTKVKGYHSVYYGVFGPHSRKYFTT